MEKVEISIFAIVIFIFIFNMALTHLLNWLYRISVDTDAVVIPSILDIIRWSILIAILNKIL